MKPFFTTLSITALLLLNACSWYERNANSLGESMPTFSGERCEGRYFCFGSDDSKKPSAATTQRRSANPGLRQAPSVPVPPVATGAPTPYPNTPPPMPPVPPYGTAPPPIPAAPPYGTTPSFQPNNAAPAYIPPNAAPTRPLEPWEENNPEWKEDLPPTRVNEMERQLEMLERGAP